MNPQPQQPPKPHQLSNKDNVQREPFRWLFVAHFKDGSKIEQPHDDRSKNHVEGREKNPSAFTDVLEHEDELEVFELVNVETDESMLVDLQTGAFVSNHTTAFHAHDQFVEPTEHKLKLIYHRETRLDHDMAGNLKRHYVNRYFIGWQAIGTKHKAIIAVG